MALILTRNHANGLTVVNKAFAVDNNAFIVDDNALAVKTIDLLLKGDVPSFKAELFAQ